jgi:hypothetical protein
MRQYQLFTDFKKAYDSVGKEVLYSPSVTTMQVKITT